MRIGEDFDKIEFQFFGLDLLEPNGVLGDLIIFATAIIFAYKISKFKIKTPFFNQWKWFFIIFGIGFFAGGIGHLFYNYLGVQGKYASWYFGILSNIFVERAMISIHPNEKFKHIANKISFGKLVLALAGLTWMISTVDLVSDPLKGMFFPILASVIGVLFCFVYLGIVYSKIINPVFKYFWISFIVTIPSVIALAFKINFAQWFDRNDLSHLFMWFGLFFYYYTVKAYSKILISNR